MAAEFSIARDRQWLVVTITRQRGDKVRTRNIYLTDDEAAILASVLARQLPAVVQGRSVDTPAK